MGTKTKNKESFGQTPDAQADPSLLYLRTCRTESFLHVFTEWHNHYSIFGVESVVRLVALVG